MFNKYRKKPVVISAVQVTLSNIQGIVDIINKTGGSCWINHMIIPEQPVVKINTLEGIMEGRIGDYIIRGVAGEFYPCKPSIFRETYEEFHNQ